MSCPKKKKKAKEKEINLDFTEARGVGWGRAPSFSRTGSVRSTDVNAVDP